MKKLILLIILFLKTIHIFSQEKTDALLLNILKKYPEKFGKILANPQEYRVQIIYTQIDRDKKNVPHFKSYGYRLNKDEYFYPASTVKFPACLLALEKLNNLNIKGLDRNSPMLTDAVPEIPNYPPQLKDLSKHDSTPTIAHYIKKILLVSDNDAFNRLYEFITPFDLNENLRRKGYKDVRIVHRLSIPLTLEQNMVSNPIWFNTKDPYHEKNCDTITLVDPITYHLNYKIRRLKDSSIYYYYEKYLPKHFFNELPRSEKPIKLGKGYMVAGKNYYVGDSLVSQPFDFTFKNYYALEDQQAVLRAALFPESIKPEQRFKLTESDYLFLYKYMSMSPLESQEPLFRQDTSMYDSYCKFLMFGDTKKPMPKNIRIFNKVGDAYGFLLDNAYIVDFEKGIEFMLSAVIYCNSDGIFNDDKYDYDKVGFPFMGDLGRAIYDYELKRKRAVKPNLSKFKMQY